MTLYSIVLFLHVVGALGFFAALAIEGLALRQIRRAASREQLREWLNALGSLHGLGGPSLLTVLVTGIYMAATVWHAPWVGVALAALFLFPILGPGLSGRRMGRIIEDVKAPLGPEPDTLGQRVHDPILVVSWRLRMAIALGITYLMTAKPLLEHALAAMAVAVVVGIIGSLPLVARRDSRPGDRVAEAESE